ncbi:MAG: IS200/IS605 family transposase [Verrucomicrobiales bacterium]|nr:IS200/IS605 family transposase [Verrucomicrobiales bacterium]
MPSTHSSLHYHIVFSSKDREPWFHGEMITDLHAYLGGVVNGLDGHSHINGGVSDHVHLLVGLKPIHRLSDFMSELKSVSSSWVKKRLRAPAFRWQEGYGAFTVGAPELGKVREYIANQAEHHRKKTFQEEYVTMLNRGMVEYKEEHLW